jgi:hypothetical protein
VNGTGYAAALVLSALFAWAGAAKLVDPTGTARTFATLGLPASHAAARVVPVAELVLAVALVVVPPVGAVVALVALAAFSAVLARALRRGVDVGCGCFGSAGHRPVSGVELLRNGLMAVAAAVVLVDPEARVPGLDAVVLVSAGLALAAVVLALADLRRRRGGARSVDLTRGPDGDAR